MTVRLAMLNLMRTMASGVAADEEMAMQFADAAIRAEASGGTSEADLLRSQSRRHWVKALELRGQLAALSEEYCERFYDDVDGGPQAP